MLRVSIFSPPLAEAYADTVSRPSSDIIEHTLIILPPPLAIMAGITALETMNGAVRSMSTTSRNSSADISCIGTRRMIPALLTSMSTAPISSAIDATIPRTASSSVTSQM